VKFPAIHPLSDEVDYVLFPYELHGCIVYDDPIAGLEAEELCEGADEVVRYFMRELNTPSIALLSSGHPQEGWTSFEYQGWENGWQVYSGKLGGVDQEMKLCPNFLLYYPGKPQVLHFTAVLASDALERYAA
jgi:hypothetical protein